MISPPSCSARRSAISDFPTAVGPAMKMGRFHFAGARRDRTAASARPVMKIGTPIHCAGVRPKMIMEIGIIAAKVFDERARDGVAKQIGRKNLAVEFLAPEQPREKKIKPEVQQRVVNFRRMQRHVERRSREFVRLRIGEGDGPRQIRRASVAAAVEQAAGAAKNAAQRDARREHVGGFPQRHFFPADVNDSGRCRADEAAVIDESAVLDHENFRERLARRIPPANRSSHKRSARRAIAPTISHKVTSAIFSPGMFSRFARSMAVHSPARNASAIITPYQWIVSGPS